MTEYLVATERSAQRSRSIVAAKKLESHKTPKETPDCSLREARHRHHTRIQGAAEGSAHTTRKGGWNVYILFNDKSARNQRIFAWTFSPYTRPLPSSNRRYSYDPPVLPLWDRMIEYNRPPSKRNGEPGKREPGEEGGFRRLKRADTLKTRPEWAEPLVRGESAFLGTSVKG